MSSAPAKPKWADPAVTNATASSSKLPNPLSPTAVEVGGSAVATASGAAPRIPDRPTDFGSSALTSSREYICLEILTKLQRIWGEADSLAYSGMQTNPYQSRMGMGSTGYGGYGGGVGSYGGYGSGYGGYGGLSGGYGGMSRMGGGYGGYGMGGYGVGNMGGPGEVSPALLTPVVGAVECSGYGGISADQSGAVGGIAVSERHK
jgi:peroxin-13